MFIRNNSLIKKIILIFLCITLLLPNFPVNAVNDIKVNGGIALNNPLIEAPSKSSLLDESVAVRFVPLTPQNLSSVTTTVYDQEMEQSLAYIKMLSLQREKLQLSGRGIDSVGNGNDLSREQVEQLVMAGAVKEDLYWINMISKESGMSPDELLDLKKNGDMTWAQVEMKTNSEKLVKHPVVDEIVYKVDIEKQLISELFNVTDSIYSDYDSDTLVSGNKDLVVQNVTDYVYGEYELNALLAGDKDLAVQNLRAFDVMVNSVFSGLITQQQINQTNKPQYSDRNATNEFIDPVNGTLTWKETEISLPGRDDLDLDIGIMYNSNQSYSFMRQYEAPGLKKYNYLVSRYDLGLGWSFQFPSVQQADGYTYYHDGQGAVYQVDFYSGDSLGSYTHLTGYQGKDRRFMQDSGTYSNGQAISAYYLEYNDLKREYFAADGRLLGIVDRYGNTIKFQHLERKTYDGATNKLISEITDSVGRTIKFTYETNLDTTNNFNGENIVVSVLNSNGAVAQKVTFKKWRTSLIHDNVPAGYAPFLWSITDQADQVTYIDYTVGSGKFHYEQKVINSYSGSTSYFNLTKITYPYSTANYQYQTTLRNFGSAGFGEEYRVISRNDVTNHIFNQAKYSYTGDYTGYDNYYNPYSLPESYRFSSTFKIVSASASNDLTTTTNFNGLHQQISSEVKTFSGEWKEIRNTNFHPTYKYLPTQKISVEYGPGDSYYSANKLYAETAYDDWGNVTSTTSWLIENQWFNATLKNKYTTSYTYEPVFHFLKTKSWYPSENSGQAIESYSYTAQGRLQSVTNALGETTAYTYENISDGKLYKEIADKTANGQRVARTVIIFGADTQHAYPTEQQQWFNIGQSDQQIVKKILTYDMGTGRLVTQTDGNNQTVSYEYDGIGRLKKETLPEVTNVKGEKYSQITEYSYYGIISSNMDAVNAGTLTLKVDSYKTVTMLSNGYSQRTLANVLYNGLGLALLEERYDDSVGKWVFTQYHYDDEGRPVYVKDTLGNETTANYDAWGRQNRSTDPYNNIYVTDFDLKQRKSTSYMLTGDTQEKLNYVETNYDHRGQVISNRTYQDWPNQSVPIIEQYSYDISGNVASYTDPMNHLNEVGVTTAYSYDALNRLTSVQDALNQSTRYTYNGNGQITNATVQGKSGSPQILNNKTYNEISLLTLKQDGASLSESRSYNALGQLISSKDRNGSTFGYTYDERGQLKTGTISGVINNVTQIQKIEQIIGDEYPQYQSIKSYTNGAVTATQRLTLDSFNQVRQNYSVSGSHSAYIQNQRDALGRITQINDVYLGFHTNYQYLKTRLDKVQTNGNSTVSSSPADNAQYNYTADSRVKTITYPTLIDGSLLKTEYTYNKALGWVESVQNGKNDGILSKFVYIYDRNGNIISVSETRNSSATNNGTARTTSYSYDALNRLVSINTPDGGNMVYTYDLRGNRQTLWSTASSTTNLVDKSYKYDLQNKLTSVTKGSNMTNFTYYANGLRYLKSTGTIHTQVNYDFDGKIITEEKLNGGDIVQKSNYIRGDRVLVKKDNTANKNYYYLYNGHGDVVQIVDTAGYPVNSYEYDVWGNITSQKEWTENSFKYAGEVYDAETGLYYLRARYYDPTMGRFLNEDTYEGGIDNPLSQNLYTYVENNPLIYTDPTGHYKNNYDFGGSGGFIIRFRTNVKPSQQKSPVKIKTPSTPVRINVPKSEMDSLRAETNSLRSRAASEGTSNGNKSLTTYNPQFAAQQMLKDGKISLKSLENMVPNGASNGFKPSTTISDGYKYNYEINGTKIEIKWHAPDANAASKFPDSNSANGWTAQIKIGNKLLGQDGKFYRNPSDITHIPVDFGG